MARALVMIALIVYMARNRHWRRLAMLSAPTSRHDTTDVNINAQVEDRLKPSQEPRLLRYLVHQRFCSMECKVWSGQIPTVVRLDPPDRDITRDALDSRLSCLNDGTVALMVVLLY